MSKEIKYEVDLFDGYCKTKCHYLKGDIRVNSFHCMEICEHFGSVDEALKILTCNHPKTKEEKKE